IAEVWQDLLGVERVGRHDHFFELGGHSLLAVQLIARLRQSLAVDVPLRELFAHPSLAAFAAQVHTAARAEAGTLPLADRTQPLPLSWAQQRLWFIDQLDHAAGAAYHIPAALRLSGHLDRTALQRTLDRIVERHESLRTTFALHQGEPIQVIAPPQVGLRLAEHDLSHLHDQVQQQAVAERAAAEAAAPFDLEHDRLIRGQLLRLSPTEHVLLVTQ
ncbi:condensation domain-containing protein, partial [Xanthomonas sacchari]|uniref:condensation domain-containing protein n=1 Tax=Xanthomonas sacchari TaxID=56458 RepID=UPI002251D826